LKHEIIRVRHELRRRSLIVRRTELVTPRMLRLILAGEQLTGFLSASPDDHIKVFAPGESGAVERRDYTPRRYDAATNELTLDFALHDAGPVTAWARSVKAGDAAEIGGPRGSVVAPHDFDWWLLVGDETALPAIGRRVEEMPAGTPIVTIAGVTGPEEEQRFTTHAEHRAVWVHRPAAQAADPAPLLAALETYAPPAGDGFIWIAAEAGVARALRKHVVEVWRHPLPWLKAGGYWTRGKADASEKLES
jgi:NADPH-dependent ferric siderophore reductase